MCLSLETKLFYAGDEHFGAGDKHFCAGDERVENVSLNFSHTHTQLNLQ